MKKIVFILFFLSHQLLAVDLGDYLLLTRQSINNWEYFSKNILMLTQEKGTKEQIEFKKNYRHYLLSLKKNTKCEYERRFSLKALLALELELKFQKLGVAKKILLSSEKISSRKTERKVFIENIQNKAEAEAKSFINEQLSEIEAQIFALKSQIYFSFSLIKEGQHVKNLSKDKNFVLHLDYLIGEKNYLLPLIETDFIFAHYKNDLNEYFKRFEKKLAEDLSEDLPA